MKLLIAEDEKALSDALVMILRHYGFEVQPAYNGQEALDYALRESYDLFIFDIMMPKMDGLEVLTEIRRRNILTPVLMLTAKAQVEDKVKGLELGADDYLAKPFPTEELVARVRALTRRNTQYSPDCLELGGVTLDRRDHTLRSEFATLHLSENEFVVLELLMQDAQKTISVDRLSERMHAPAGSGGVLEVRVYITYLQKKLDSLEAKCSIREIDTEGYRIEVDS